MYGKPPFKAPLKPYRCSRKSPACRASQFAPRIRPASSRNLNTVELAITLMARELRAPSPIAGRGNLIQLLESAVDNYVFTPQGVAASSQTALDRLDTLCGKRRGFVLLLAEKRGKGPISRPQSVSRRPPGSRCFGTMPLRFRRRFRTSACTRGPRRHCRTHDRIEKDHSELGHPVPFSLRQSQFSGYAEPVLTARSAFPG